MIVKFISRLKMNYCDMKSGSSGNTQPNRTQKTNNMTNEQIIERVNVWQNAGFVHEMTCGYDSSHEPLIPVVVRNDAGNDVVRLQCKNCEWYQAVPEMVIEADPDDIAHIKQLLIDKGFKF